MKGGSEGAKRGTTQDLMLVRCSDAMVDFTAHNQASALDVRLQ
jgi:hypothetical protein